jgi:hypothetical protein
MENKKEEVVSLPKSALDQIMAQLAALQQAVGTPSVQKATEIKNRTVVVRYVDDKPVVAFANIGHPSTPVYTYEKPNPLKPSEMILYARIIMLDEDGEKEAPIEVQYLEFMNHSRKVTCKIVKSDDKKWSDIQGETEKTKVDWDKFKTESTGDIVALKVEGITRTYTVEDPTGRVYELAEQTINI